jgi:hypothetical protein
MGNSQIKSHTSFLTFIFPTSRGIFHKLILVLKFVILTQIINLEFYLKKIKIAIVVLIICFRDLFVSSRGLR